MRKRNYLDRSNSTPQGGVIKEENIEVVPAKAPKKKPAPAEEVVAEEVVAEEENTEVSPGIKGISVLLPESD